MPLQTVVAFPATSATVAKFCFAAICDMKATMAQFHNTTASRAGFPLAALRSCAFNFSVEAACFFLRISEKAPQ